MKIIQHLLQKMAPIPCSAPDCATTFQENLDATVLLALIEIHSRTAHQTTAPTHSQPTVKAEKVKRPTLTSSGTSEEFIYFQQRWSMYKVATKLEGQDVIFQLLECCDEPLRKDLTRTHGDVAGETEQTVLGFIKTFAVRPENKMVARVQLEQIRQDREEPVRAFCARLRGQAGVCQFTIKCECGKVVDYSEEMIRDRLIRGLDDEDIKLDVLGQANQEMSLPDTLQLVETKESGKRSANRLDGTTTATMNSTYKRQNNMPPQQRPNNSRPSFPNNSRPSLEQRDSQYQQTEKFASRPCTHCGQTGHASYLRERIKHCSAYNKQCRKCGIHHHHHSVCRRPSQKAPSHQNAMNQDDSTYTYNSPCATDDVQVSAITLDHHVYDNLCNTWTRRRSDPQPTINVSVSFQPSDAPDLHLQSSVTASPSVSYHAMADTGCQSCLSGVDLLRKLHLNNSDLHPVSMSMTAANDKRINIIGALPLRITGISPSGISHTTRQIVYFTDSTNKLFLSKQACESLGIIS